MTEPLPDDPTRDASTDRPDAIETTAVTSAYKVLGELTDSGGVGVLGQNGAASGTPVGVQGAVPNAGRGYGLATPDDARHMGPMAEEFHDTFELGDDDEHIATVDADGVALAAIQGLAQCLDDARTELDEKDDRIAALEAETGRIDDLEATVEDKDERIEELKTENEQLRERVPTIEAHLDVDGTEKAPTDD